MFFRETFEENLRIIHLDRPPLNLFDIDSIQALSSAFHCHDRSQPLVLTGANGVFSAGVDTKAYARYDEPARAELAQEITRMTARLLSIPSAVVAAVPGHALGGGLVLMLCADYRVVADNDKARFALSEGAAGVPFPSGPAEIIRHEIPAPLLRHMTITSQYVSRETLFAANLLDDVREAEDLVASAVEAARTLHGQPGFQAVKRQIRGPLLRAVTTASDEGVESSVLSRDGQ